MVTTKEVKPGNFEWTGEAQELTAFAIIERFGCRTRMRRGGSGRRRSGSLRRDLQYRAFFVGRRDADLIEDLKHEHTAHIADLARSSKFREKQSGF